MLGNAIKLRPVRALLLILKEMGRFIISLPRRAVEGLFEDFSELAGRTMQDLVGSSSVVEVVGRESSARAATGRTSMPSSPTSNVRRSADSTFREGRRSTRRCGGT